MHSDRLAKKARMPDTSQRSLLPSPGGGRAGDEGTRPLRRKPPLPHSLKERIRELRSRGTDAEKTMWHLLRNRGFHGAKFRRQHPIGPFVLDFYCEQARLGIELDGSSHTGLEQILSDTTRSRLLQEQYGIRVIRFWNNDVLRETDTVLNRLWTVLASRLASPGAGSGASTPELPSGSPETLGTTSSRS